MTKRYKPRRTSPYDFKSIHLVHGNRTKAWFYTVTYVIALLLRKGYWEFFIHHRLISRVVPIPFRCTTATLTHKCCVIYRILQRTTARDEVHTSHTTPPLPMIMSAARPSVDEGKSYVTPVHAYSPPLEVQDRLVSSSASQPHQSISKV